MFTLNSSEIKNFPKLVNATMMNQSTPKCQWQKNTVHKSTKCKASIVLNTKILWTPYQVLILTFEELGYKLLYVCPVYSMAV